MIYRLDIDMKQQVLSKLRRIDLRLLESSGPNAISVDVHQQVCQQNKRDQFEFNLNSIWIQYEWTIALIWFCYFCLFDFLSLSRENQGYLLFILRVRKNFHFALFHSKYWCCLSVCLSVCVSVCLSVSLSVCL